MPRKQLSIEESIRLNKFVERKPDRKDEQFFYFGVWWNISEMIKYIEQTGKAVFQYSMSQLEGAGYMVDIDEDYAKTADLTKPGIIIQLTSKHILLVDGNHRLYRAKFEGKQTFNAYYLTLEEQTHFITDRESLRVLESFKKSLSKSQLVTV